jgi:hypothetical protein
MGRYGNPVPEEIKGPSQYWNAPISDWDARCRIYSKFCWRGDYFCNIRSFLSFGFQTVTVLGTKLSMFEPGYSGILPMAQIVQLLNIYESLSLFSLSSLCVSRLSSDGQWREGLIFWSLAFRNLHFSRPGGEWVCIEKGQLSSAILSHAVACILKAEMGKLTYVKSPQIANPQILGLIPLLQIRKFLRCTSPQIANPQIFMIKPQIANPKIFIKFCTTLSQTSSFKNDLLLFFTVN